MSGKASGEEGDEATPTAPKSLQNLLADLKVPSECPRCSNPTWWNMGGEQVRTTQRQVGVHLLSVYTVACQNCGLIQEHVSAIVEGKVRDTT